MRRLSHLLSLMVLFWTAAAQSEPILVRSGDQLSRALSSASPGQRIELAPGDYGSLLLKRIRYPADMPVVVVSADPNQPAHIAGLDLRDSSGLWFEGLVFDYRFDPGHKPNQRPFNVAASEGITFQSNRFTGDVARGVSQSSDGFPTGFGLSVRGSRNIRVAGNEIEGFYRGLVIGETQHAQVVGNDLHSIRMDGMNFAEVQDVLIEDNHIHDFIRSLTSGDHADMIQFWTNGTSNPSVNIVIRNNRLDAGAGWYTQSIFMRNEEVDRSRAGDEMFYRDVLIEGNRIRNAHLHGITTGETHGLVIRDNDLAYLAQANPEGKKKGVYIPQIRVSPVSTGVVITGNSADRIELASRNVKTWPQGWTVKDNRVPETAPVPAAAEKPRERSDFTGALLAFDAVQGWSVPPAGNPGAIVIGGGEAMRVDAQGVVPLFGAREFALELRLRAGQGPKSAGGILHAPGAISIDIGERGNLQVAIETDGARRAVTLYALAPQLLDGNAHDIGVFYGARGKARLVIDGQEVASVVASGLVGKGQPTAIMLGAGFNRKGPFQGEILRLSLKLL